MNETKSEIDSTYGIYDVEFEIRASKTPGEYSLRLKKDGVSKYVVSKYAPREKIKEKLILFNKNSSTLFIVFGFAFGYIADEIFKVIGPNAKIFVIEPTPKLLEAQANLVNRAKYSSVKFYNELSFERFYSHFYQSLHMSNINHVEVLDLFDYKFFYDKYFNRIKEIISVSKSDLQTNIGTVSAIGKRFLGNLLSNSKYINSSYDVTNIKNKYKDIPAVLVMAGPSLDKNLEDLKDFDGLILCVGRTVQSVKGIGKNPDFSFIVDYSTKMDATFGGYYDIPLIALISCAEEVISKWQDKIYFITHDETFKELIDVELPDFEINISVSTLAIEFAKYIGANPIIVIGQDLGFTPDKEYSKTCNVYEDTKRLENVNVEKSDLYELVPGYYEGESVLSTTVFTAIKRWMQRFIKHNPNIEFINATEGGAKIIGTLQMPLKKAIEKYNKSKYNSDYEPKLLFPEPIDVEARLAKTVEKLEEQKELVQKIIEVSKELMHEYTQYQPETSPEKIREIYPKLYNLEVELSKLEVERISRYMFEKLSYDISKDEEYKQQARRSDVENAIKITEGNVLIYKALELAISDAIDRINNRIGLESAENE